MNNKFNSLMFDYALRNNNFFAGSGLGGNEELFLFMTTSKKVLSKDVEDAKVIDNVILWNEEFLASKSIKDIRAVVDDKFKTAIKEQNITFNVDKDLIAFKEKFDFKQILIDNVCDPEKLESDYYKFLYSLALTEELISQIDSNTQNDNTYKNYESQMNKIDIYFSMYSIRSKISLEKIIEKNIDDKLFELFKKFSNQLA